MRNRVVGAFTLLGIAALALPVRAASAAQGSATRTQNEKPKEAEPKRPPAPPVQKAPEKERAKTPAPAANPGAPTVEQQRDIAKRAAYYARRSRDQQARIDRLIQIYQRKGDTEKVRKLEGMRTQLVKRTDNAMEGFRKRLGDEKWGQLNSEMKKHHGRDEHQKPKETRPPEKRKS